MRHKHLVQRGHRANGLVEMGDGGSRRVIEVAENIQRASFDHLSADIPWFFPIRWKAADLYSNLKRFVEKTETIFQETT